MLEELRITNFAIIDKLVVEFTDGFNVITGETGAGKSIVVDAVEMLIGAKADKSYIRSGAKKAIVEGTFALTDRVKAQVVPVLMEAELIQREDEANYITLSRELRRSGRSSSRINGVACNQNVLSEVGELLVDIHGQSGHLSLFKPRAHMDLLDRYADLLEVRQALAEVVNGLYSLRREMATLEEDKELLQRRADRLRYEVDDIDAADLEVGEEDTMQTEYDRLANSEKLAELSGEAFGLLSSTDDDDFMPAVDLLQQVSATMDKLIRLDKSLGDDQALAGELAAGAQELSINLGRYFDSLDHDQERLNELEERLDVLRKLKRRYQCETIEELLAYADEKRAELESIDNSEERLEKFREEEDRILHHIGELSERISKVREVASRQLSKKVVRELGDLRMEKAQFQVVRERKADKHGAYGKDGKRYKFDSNGIESVEFLLSANPGEPLRPLAKIASGGEAARIMLALKRVLTQADYTPTLIFDEIDTGIGGRLGSVVGEKLWSLTDGHQVLCVTHLPQLASYGDRHLHVTKNTSEKRTVSKLNHLDTDDARVLELADMMGAIGDSGVQSARDILNESIQHKKRVVDEKLEQQKSLL
ncbi:MAG: DNA repair protein RecN [Chloroflexota bacterium]